MFNENDDDGGGKLVCESFDEFLVHCWDSSVLESSGHGAQNRKDRFRAVMPICKIADEGVKKNNESGSECRDEEKHLGSLWQLSSSKVTSIAYQIQHRQSSQAHSSIKLGSPEMLQDVNNNLVCSVSVGESSNSHQRRDLTNSNIQCRPSHVGRNSRQRDEVDYPATTDEPDEADDSTSNDGKGGSNDVRVRFILGERFNDFGNHGAGNC